MKIDAIRVRNVRRFGADGFELGPIPDGVSILAQDNEFGKTTLFDALKMALFTPYTSGRTKGSKAQREFQPYGLDEPAEIEVDFTAGGARYRLYKRYFRGRPTALLLDPDTGQALARDGQAEDRLKTLLGTDRIASGPQGLLWVAQGKGLERPTPDADHQALLSSFLQTEVADTASGEAARAVLAAARARLAELVTERRQQPTGPYRQALDAAEDARRRHEELTARESALEGSLESLARIDRQLTEYDDPKGDAETKEKLARAEADLARARSHAQRIDALRTTVRATESEEREAEAILKRLHDDHRRAGQRADALEGLRQAAADNRHQLALAQEAADRAGAAVAAAHDLLAEREAAERASQAAANRQTIAEEAERQRARLKTVRSLLAERDALPPFDPAALIDDDTLARIAEAERRLLAAQIERDAQTTRVSATYASPSAPALRVGPHSLGEAPVVISGETDIALPGIGVLHLHAPKGTGAEDGVRSAERDLQRALSAAGATSHGDAQDRRRAAERQKAALTAMEDRIAALCPEGIEALTRHCAALDAEETGPTDAPGPDEARAAVDAAFRQLGDARTTAATAAATLTARRAEESRLAADIRQREEQDAAPADPEVLAASEKRHADAQREARSARQALADAMADAPDLAMAEAATRRLEQARQQRIMERQRLREERAAVFAGITLVREEGVGEALAEAADRKERAERTVRAFEQEVSALTLLIETVDELRRTARDTFLAPVRAAITPLLRGLFPQADLTLGDDFGPETLDRRGLDEPLERLSGGTREQIALITRLAFGQILARGGHPLPIVLDDPGVFGDDHRTERLFDLFARIGEEVQLIILTCHRSRYATAGAQPLSFSAWPKPPYAMN